MIRLGVTTDDRFDALDELAPRALALAERRAAGAREPIGPPAPPADRALVAPQESRQLQAIERRVDRAFGEVEPAAALQAQGPG